MELGYTLEWLDLVISQALDPGRTNLLELDSQQAVWIAEKALKEKVRHLSLIKNYVFSIADDHKIQLIVGQYYGTLSGLLVQVKTNYARVQSLTKTIENVFDTITQVIEEIMSMIAERFSQYLDPHEVVPDSYLAKNKVDLAGNIHALKPRLLACGCDEELVVVVLGVLESHILGAGGGKVTFQNLEYSSLLLEELQRIVPKEKDTDAFFSPLETLLIRMNFNGLKYVHYLTKKIGLKIQTLDNYEDRVENMHYLYQQFHQIQVKKSIAYDPDCEHLQVVIENWFAQEIIFLEKKLHSVPVAVTNQKKPVGKSKQSTEVDPESKVLCIMSVDQMALFLKAADELKILSARSMSTVFKTLAPYLSTPYQEELSWESMRTKTYSPEDRDKKILIQTLEKMITKISEF